MNGKLQNDKIILGLKVRQLRTDKGLSLSELNKKSGMSISYLNEIEKGKKYPREDKLNKLAGALEISPEQLTSSDLPAKLDPIVQLLNSNFLQDLPLDFFKIELVKIIEIIANAPAQVGAFITTLVELARNYAMQQESFYFAALRSYLELHNNYFEDLESQARQLIEKHQLPESGLLPHDRLAEILENQFDYKIVENGLDKYPELKAFRSVFLPKSKQLLLNSQLTDRQRAFQFGKEIGFNILKVRERANTSSLLRPKSFNEVLNHSKAIYFSVALLMNEQEFIQDVTKLFSQQRWNGKQFLDIMNKFGSSPEMFFHRMTNILPKVFDLDKLFFIRFIQKSEGNKFKVDRVFHLNDSRHLQQSELSEHH
ncbi:MAG: XRE family transcriptional regulator, partial [Bacteroidota bacterium]